MKKLFTGLMVAGLFLLFGCSNLVDENVNSTDSVAKGRTFPNDGKAYLCVSRATTGTVARTALPAFTDDSLANFAFTLEGRKSNETEGVTLGTYETLSDLTADSIAVETGTWDFTLTAQKDGTVFTGEINEKEILTGANSLSFALSWSKTALSGKGSLNFELDLSSAENSSSVVLTTGELVKYNTITATETAVPEYAETELTIAGGKVSYTLSDIDSGNYRVKIRLYADSQKKNLINTWRELAIITGGQTSSASREMTSLNQVYSITYVTNGGKATEGTSFQESFTRHTETITLSELTKTGYEFGGWYTNADFTGSAVTSVTTGSTGNKTFYAKFTPETYTISFVNSNQNAASGTMAGQTFTYGEEQSLNEFALTITPGYEFKEWNTSADGTGTSYNYESPCSFTEDTILYAIWTLNEYTIAYNLNDDTKTPATNENTNKTSYTVEDLPLTLAAPTRSGYAFGGWYKDASFETAISEITAISNDGENDYKLFAKWTAASVSVTVSSEDNLSLTYEKDKTEITFTASNGSGSYIWRVNEEAQDETSSTFVLETSPLGTGTYIVEVTSGDLSSTATVSIAQIDTQIYVTAKTLSEGETDTGDGTEANPYTNIQNAIEKIWTNNASSLDYTIIVSGMDNSSEKTSGNDAGVLIADDTSTFPAKSLLIQGADGTDDGIYGTAYKYCPIAIKTSVPVTFKNFAIKMKGYINGDNKENGFAFVMNPGADVTFSEGFTIDGTESDSWEYSGSLGAVYVAPSATLTMESNAAIHDLKIDDFNSSTKMYSGAVFVAGTFEMKGTSSIYNIKSTAAAGGAIYITSGGNATMSGNASIGGENKACTSSYGGGGVYVASNGAFTMNGGTISYCSGGASGGGGVMIKDGTFTMNNGTISNNTWGTTTNTSAGGGGIFVYSGTFNFAGGTIKDNNNYGVYVYYSGSTPGTFNMSGSATVDSSNPVFLYSESASSIYAKITVTGVLSGTSPVATITPDTYSGDITVLEVASDSGTTLAAEYEKFAVTQPSGAEGWYIGSTGTVVISAEKVTKTSPTSVGDIVFNDGTAIAYSDFKNLDETVKNEKKELAIALIFYNGTGLNSDDADGNADTTTSRMLGVGLRHKITGLLAWCTDSANAYNTNITTIQCPANGESGSLTFTGDKNGSDNLEQIASFLTAHESTDDTATPENYPAFYFAKNYATSEGTNIASGSDFATGWYLPSIAELFQIYACRADTTKGFDIDEASEALGGNKFGTSSSSQYWSSTQYASTDTTAYEFYFNNGGWAAPSKFNSGFSNYYVCCIREF